MPAGTTWRSCGLAGVDQLRTDLALDALDMGLWAPQRAGKDVTGLIHHSDRALNIERFAKCTTCSLATTGRDMRLLVGNRRC